MIAHCEIAHSAYKLPPRSLKHRCYAYHRAEFDCHSTLHAQPHPLMYKNPRPKDCHQLTNIAFVAGFGEYGLERIYRGCRSYATRSLHINICYNLIPMILDYRLWRYRYQQRFLCEIKCIDTRRGARSILERPNGRISLLLNCCGTECEIDHKLPACVKGLNKEQYSYQHRVKRCRACQCQYRSPPKNPRDQDLKH